MTKDNTDVIPEGIKAICDVLGIDPDDIEVTTLSTDEQEPQEDTQEETPDMKAFLDDLYEALTESYHDEHECEKKNNTAKTFIASGINDPETLEAITGVSPTTAIKLGADAEVKDYIVSVKYDVIGHYRVKATSVQDAIDTIKDNAEQLPPLKHPATVVGSQVVQDDADYTKLINNTEVKYTTDSKLVSEAAKTVQSDE